MILVILKSEKFKGIGESVENTAQIPNVRFTRINTGDYRYVLTSAQLS